MEHYFLGFMNWLICSQTHLSVILHKIQLFICLYSYLQAILHKNTINVCKHIQYQPTILHKVWYLQTYLLAVYIKYYTNYRILCLDSESIHWKLIPFTHFSTLISVHNHMQIYAIKICAKVIINLLGCRIA